MRNLIIVFFATITLTSCDTLQQGIDAILNGNSGITQGEAVGGLREALSVGFVTATNILSKENGYYKDPTVKIPWPEEAEFVMSAMTALGMGDKVDNVTESLNRAAEKAAGEAVDVFIGAIKQMTFQDAMGIVTGGDGAATEYLVRTTTNTLVEKFRPIIDNSLGDVNATKIWSETITRYNKIPFAKPVETDLTTFVTTKAMEGLFKKVEEKENDIRQNVGARTSGLLQKVFGYADQKKSVN